MTQSCCYGKEGGCCFCTPGKGIITIVKEAWERLCAAEPEPKPVVDRRGAIEHSRSKNEGS